MVGKGGVMEQRNTEIGLFLEFTKMEYILPDFKIRDTCGQGNFLFWQISNRNRKSYPLGAPMIGK